jgi:tRNA modification GTPase
MNQSMSDTIAAISTAKGKSALSVIRISGPKTFELLAKIVKSKINFEKLQLKESKKVFRKMYKANFYDENRLIDEGMICLFKAPSSFTGEDMAELYCHGNDFIVSQVLESILRYCRLATKGEFTLRAFLNRKIDLTQAEAIANLLSAQTKKAQKAALLQLEGRLKTNISSILSDITKLRVIFELAIDFVEDEVPEFDIENLLKDIDDIIFRLQSLINTAHDGIVVQNGIKICLAGAPNVGKSSIFNAFLQTERAIVTPIPGTTRDYIEEAFALSGYLIRLFDTAGIRDSQDTVEKIGIERSLSLIQTADIVFYVTTNEISEDINNEFLALLPPSKTIKVINKADLLTYEQQENFVKQAYVLCSAVQGKEVDGLKNLKEKLLANFNNIDDELENGVITNSRQLSCVKNCLDSVLKAKEGLLNENGIDFVAFDIQQASNALENIIGRISNDDILNKIFDNFCIGK